MDNKVIGWVQRQRNSHYKDQFIEILEEIRFDVEKSQNNLRAYKEQLQTQGEDKLLEFLIHGLRFLQATSSKGRSNRINNRF